MSNYCIHASFIPKKCTYIGDTQISDGKKHISNLEIRDRQNYNVSPMSLPPTKYTNWWKYK
jgi:hypothetical protein